MFASSFKGNTKGLNKLLKRVSELKDAKLDVGYFDDIHQSSGLPVAAIAAINNEGVSEKGMYIPARPFVSEALRMAFFQKAAMRPARQLLDYKIPLKLTLGRIGSQAVELFRWNIYNGAWADNAPYTISLKGKNAPLVDTGEMASLTKYRIKFA